MTNVPPDPPPWPDPAEPPPARPNEPDPAKAPESFYPAPPSAPVPVSYPAPQEPGTPYPPGEEMGSPFDSEPGSNRAPIIAGIVTALLVLTGLAYFIFTNQPEPVVAPPTTAQRPPITTTLPPTTQGPGSAVPGYEPVFQTAQCRFSLVADVDYDCGWLIVPEDRQNPDNGREVRIHVARFTSPNPDAPDDPVIYLEGGPGAATLEPLQLSFAQAWRPLLDDRDLILFDQRGVGYSTPSLDCPEEREWEFDTLDENLSPEEEQAGDFAALVECRDRLERSGVGLAQYNSAENAADVADLRLALGLEEVNLLGISYGTRLATTVMRDHPAGIRSVVLDSTYTPDVSLLAEAPANFDRALDKLWEGCRRDPDCNDRYGDIESRFYALVDAFDATPITASVRNFLGGGSWDVLFDGDWIRSTFFQGLYSGQVIPLLPQLIEELEAGETATLTLLTSNTLANSEFVAYGMHLSVQCNEEISFTTPDEVAAGLAGFEHIAGTFDGNTNVGEFMFAVCPMWEAGTAAPIEAEPVESPIPTLVLAGEYDPITPPAWGASAAAYLANATYVEFPGLGHGTSVVADCPLSVVFAFYNDPQLEPDVGCVAAMPGIDFTIPGEAPAALELVPFTEDVLGATVSGVVPKNWTSIGFGAYTRSDSAVDQTAIMYQVAPLFGPEEFVGLLAGQFGMDGDPEPTSTHDNTLGSWQLYRGEVEGFSVDIAAVDLGGSTGVVVLISDPAEREYLLGELMFPALDAFRTE